MLSVITGFTAPVGSPPFPEQFNLADYRHRFNITRKYSDLTNDGYGKYGLTLYAMREGSAQIVAADLTNNGKIGIAALDYYTDASPTVTVWPHK